MNLAKFDHSVSPSLLELEIALYSKVRRVWVLGIGESGYQAALLAQERGFEVVAYDEGNHEKLQIKASQLKEQGIQVFLQKIPQEDHPSPDLVILSPGIPPSSKLYQSVTLLQVPIISEIQFASFYLSSVSIIGITGTNGKTTTTELITYLLNQCGRRAVAVGNIGVPLSAIARQINLEYDYLVCECSSFQLAHTPAFPISVGIFLNFSNNHLDWHPDLTHYFISKTRLLFPNIPFHPIRICQQQVYQHPYWQNLCKEPEVLTFGIDTPSASIWYSSKDQQIIFSNPCHNSPQKWEVTEFPANLRFLHNIENVMAGCITLDCLGCSLDQLPSWIQGFKVPAHRLEIVGSIDNITFVNDSKATNPAAIESAILAMTNYQDSYEHQPRRILLIAGGRDKKMDFGIIKPTLQKYVREAILLGENRYALAECWGNVIPCSPVDSLEEAIDQAILRARGGDIILFSPGATSFDMFRDYADRGNQFKLALKRRQGHAQNQLSIVCSCS